MSSEIEQLEKFIAELKQSNSIPAKAFNEHDINELFLVKRYRVADTGESYRTINHWANEGLLDNKKDNRQWREFNFLDLIWIYIITTLRKFNISLPVIKELRKNLYSYPNGYEEIVKVLPDFPFYSFVVLYATVLEVQYFLCVKPDGDWFIVDRNGYEFYPYYSQEDNYISISLTRIIDLVLYKNSYRPKNLQNLNATNKEMVILSKLRQKMSKMEINMISGSPASLKIHSTRKNTVSLKELKDDNKIDLVTWDKKGKQIKIMKRVNLNK